MVSENSEYDTDNQQERLIPKKHHLMKKKDEIINMYLNEKLSIRAIAKRIKGSLSGVKRILHKFNIQRRNKCESLNLCPSNFTKEEFQIVLGTVLGDGHLVKPKKNGESQLYLGHSPKQKEYLEWKYNKLKRFIGCNIYPLTHHLKYKGEIRKHITLNFLTRKSKLFTEIENKLYVRNRREEKKYKRIFDYEYIKNNLNDLGLAVWYMDDGNKSKNCNACYLCTQSFTYDDNEKIVDFLINKFGIISQIVKASGRNNVMLRIRSKDASVLYKTVCKHIIKSMRYKLGRLVSSETITSNTRNSEDRVRSI